MNIDFKKALHDILGEKLPALQKFFAERKEKFDANPNPAPAPASSPAPATKELTTKDGKKLAVAGELAVDSMIMDMSGPDPVPLDGIVELADGTEITAVAGKITVIEPASAEPNPAEPAYTVAQFNAHKIEFEKQFNAKFAAQDKVIKEQAATIDDHNTMLKQVVEFMAMVTKTPVAEPKPAPTQIQFTKQLSAEEYAKLSSNDKRRHNEQFPKP